MKSILAFGDSNTWGFVPGTRQMERYPWEVRWTGILQKKYEDVRIIEEGLCGRTTAFEDDLRPGRRGASALPLILESHRPLDAAIIMLGTNDCKSVYSVSANTIGKGMSLCLDEMEKYIPPRNILLISPIFLGEDVWRDDKDPEFGKQSVIVSRELKHVYQRIANERGMAFLAASDYVIASDVDSEHMDDGGHNRFAAVLHEKLREMITR